MSQLGALPTTPWAIPPVATYAERHSSRQELGTPGTVHVEKYPYNFPPYSDNNEGSELRCQTDIKFAGFRS